MSAYEIAPQIGFWGLIIVFSIGVPGALANVILFVGVKTFRQSPLAYYVVGQSLADVNVLLIEFLQIIPSVSVSTSSIACKLMVFFVQATACAAMNFLCLSAFDRWACTSQSARIRQLSSPHVARRLFLLPFILWSLVNIPFLIYFDLVPPTFRCLYTNDLFMRIGILVLSPIFTALLPLIVLIMFGLMTYRNIRLVVHVRQQPNQIRLSNWEHQMTRMMLTQTLDFEILLQAALNRDMWALKVLDAWGKPLPSGLLKGNTYWVGNYDECIQPMYLPNNKTFLSQPFDTQYCTLTTKASPINSSSMLSFVLGLCVPSSCDRQEVVSLIDTLFNKSNITKDNLACSNDPPNGQKGLTHGAIATIVILSFLGLLVLMGTIIDLVLMSRINSADNMTTHRNGYTHFVNAEAPENELVKSPRDSFQALIPPTPHIVFLAEFSALKSLHRIFTMKQKNEDNSFLFINGIRVLSLFCVIIGHSLSFGFSYSSNIMDVLSWTRNIAFQLVINGALSVDTFFVLSGFLTAVLFVRQVEKEGKLSFRLMFLYYIHRYIRLTPTFLLMVLVSINLTPYLGHGPVYPTQQGFEPTGCRTQYWWTSILYIGNLVKSDSMCLGVSWYLHNDMQFHWIAPFALIPFVIGRKSLSFLLTILLVLIGIGSILTIVLYYSEMPLGSLAAFTATDGPTLWKTVYIKPWCRVSAYAIGMLTGYFVIHAGRQYRINKCTKFFGTVFVVLIGLACLFVTYPDCILVSGLSRPVLVAYQSLSRTLWSIVIGWILFLCSINQGGIVNKILSWPIWSPFAKLNYSCYLVHATIIFIILFNQTMPLYYQGHLVVNNFVSHIFFSYAAATVVAIFFETPFFIIEKKLFKR
ncbi:unnamed protein product [Rotaria sp. Silwood1]|nr:unnamed protein product [Rotaria sp. Silwood1]